jgi:archaellum component FlaF (FlaF/FlaG flagellin family)
MKALIISILVFFSQLASAQVVGKGIICDTAEDAKMSIQKPLPESCVIATVAISKAQKVEEVWTEDYRFSVVKITVVGILIEGRMVAVKEVEQFVLVEEKGLVL